MLHCTQNELLILSALNPTCNYPCMAGKKECNRSNRYCIGVFVVAMIMAKDNCTENELQILSALNHTCSYPRYGLKKTDATYPRRIALRVFIVAMIMVKEESVALHSKLTSNSIST